MGIDLQLFSDKFRRYLNQFETPPAEFAKNTGIPLLRIESLMKGQVEPTGDEILIIADFFKCDFKFFISNEILASFEQTESLFRKLGDKLSIRDRWAIQEFLFLCECQQFLLQMDASIKRTHFAFSKSGTYFKQHGQDAAAELREHLGYKFNEVRKDIYSDFRSIGIHVFRRTLGHSDISGIFIRHPVAGGCVLVNYSEDVFRQRFTAAHEVAHAILDDGKDFVVSFTKWNPKDLSEVRANTFASNFLMPPEFLRAIPKTNWDQINLIDWCGQLMVNADPLIYALKDAGVVTQRQATKLKGTRVEKQHKTDPELPPSLTSKTRKRKESLLQQGLSDAYVKLCFEAHEKEVISTGRLAEMLLLTEEELTEIADIYGTRLRYGD